MRSNCGFLWHYVAPRRFNAMEVETGKGCKQVKDAVQKMFLILENLRVHYSKPVKAWVDEHNNRFDLFYLSSYSPELNSEERLNADLKYAICSKVSVHTKSKLNAAATVHMQTLEQLPERIKKYFQGPRIRYTVLKLQTLAGRINRLFRQ